MIRIICNRIVSKFRKSPNILWLDITNTDIWCHLFFVRSQPAKTSVERAAWACADVGSWPWQCSQKAPRPSVWPPCLTASSRRQTLFECPPRAHLWPHLWPHRRWPRYQLTPERLKGITYHHQRHARHQPYFVRLVVTYQTLWIKLTVSKYNSAVNDLELVDESQCQRVEAVVEESISLV